MQRTLVATRLALVAGFTALAALPLTAQAETEVEPGQDKVQKEAAQKEAAQIIERYLEVCGGREASAKLKNRITELDVELEGQGMKFSLKAYHARPNKAFVRGEIAGLGPIEEGSNGTNCWSENAMTGLVVHKDEELADKLLSSSFDSVADWRELFKTAIYKGEVEIDDATCQKIVMTPAVGSEQTWFFDKKSGLLVQQEGTVKEMGSELDTVTKVSDYREVDGVLMPFKQVTDLGSIMKQVVTVHSIEHNVEIADDRFDLPEAAVKVLEKRKAKAEKKKQREKEKKAKDKKGAGSPR